MIKPIYRIVKSLVAENAYTAWLEFDAKHPLYRGHFPGMPVTPGAVLLQTAEELIGVFSEQPYKLTGAKQLKFLRMHHSGTPLRFDISLEEGTQPCAAKIVICDDLGAISKMTVELSF
jgi:3-hydroxymyristoyl/3-hydroxydecanoyl-(acyl carrier protein) dehydratases